MERSRALYNNNTSSVSTFDQNPSDSDIPLRPYGSDPDPGFEGSTHQQWDEAGHAIGYAPDPRLHAPRPRPPSFSPTTLYAPPDAAAAVTYSIRPEPEDEWSNAETPKTARPSETITPLPIPTNVPIPRLEHTLPAPGELSPPSQYAVYRPENPISGNPGAGSELAQPHFNQSSPVTGFDSVPSHTFSPPPSYQ
jgi:hypothetical protein